MKSHIYILKIFSKNVKQLLDVKISSLPYRLIIYDNS